MAQVALVLVSIAVSLCGVEVVLRFALPQIFDVHPRGMYIQEESVGYVLTPGFTGVLSRSEFDYSFGINQVSQRGADRRRRKGNSFQVVCLGDSFAWGFGGIDAEVFTSRLEAALARRFPDREVQVIN